MKLHTILSYLTYPGKNHPENEDFLTGTLIPIDTGKLSRMLKDIFDNANKNCDIPIIFNSPNNDQKNVVKDHLLSILSDPTIENALPLAKRLQQSTTGTSGMGLLFLCLGSNDDGKQRIVLSRFPAEEGVVAEKRNDQLSVQFVDQVFLKSSLTYKAAVYEGKNDSDFWTGYAVDRQINNGLKSIAAYWIMDFLDAEFRTTGAAGTKRLATALKAALAITEDLSVKHEIASCIPLATNMPNIATTIAGFCDHFHLSSNTKSLVCGQVKPARLLNDTFQFDKTEFNRHVSYKAVEMDNGALLSAQVDKFDQCFHTTYKEGDSRVTISTTGKIINEKLRKIR